MAVRVDGRGKKPHPFAARKAAKKVVKKAAKKAAKKAPWKAQNMSKILSELARAPKPAKASTPPRAGTVESLRAALGMPRSTFARLVGHSERSIANWESSASVPQGLAAQRLAELERLKASLGEVIDPATIGSWLEKPNPAFGGLKPLEAIERGEIDRLWKMVFELHSGALA